ncbi:hypothetical protein QF035_000895 [Streptomyces umbrinus]|uniref:Uncharacterized protein n=1 Tax=Streptomyces umbrinus TaxID=67370 RepID=A0ABU0SIB5_9ACTN|nr:hypothetical protein [Streptomyces umbrinus]
MGGNWAPVAFVASWGLSLQLLTGRLSPHHLTGVQGSMRPTRMA